MGKRVWFPVVSGPLAPYAAGFESWLRSRSYSASAAANRLCQLDQLSRWLERNGLGAGRLTPQQAAEFVGSRREMGLVTWTSPQSVALPLEYLREIGVVPIPAPAASDGPLEELLAGAWRGHLPRPSARQRRFRVVLAIKGLQPPNRFRSSFRSR